MGITSLKQGFQSIQQSGMELYRGTVIADNPLKVQIGHNLIIENSLITVPKHLTDYSIMTEINGEFKEIMFRNSLMERDSVMLLAYNNKKQYYVLDRC